MLPTMLTLWGVVTALQGLVHSYSGLLACRFFLGLLEGGSWPGIVLYLSWFYPRSQMHLRFVFLTNVLYPSSEEQFYRLAAFFSAATLAGAFGGILAYGIVQIPSSRPSWAWIFIIEGVFTVAFGLVSFFILPQSPATCTFLSVEEKAYVAACVNEESPDEEKFSWKEVAQAFKDPHVGFLAIICFLHGVLLFSLA